MNLPKIAVRNHQFTLIATLLLCLYGVIALINMPKSEDPQVAKPGASIFVLYPGSTPADMEQLVVEPIEEALNELDNIKRITSQCKDGLAVIGIEFEMGSDPDEKFSDVNEKVNGARELLPPDLLLLDTMKWSVSDTNIMQLALISPNTEYRDLEKQGERLEKILKKVPGVKKVELLAFPKQEIRVALNLERMARLRIPLNRVASIIQSSNLNIPGGSIDVGVKRFSIQTSGSFESLEQIKNTVIHSDGAKVVYLRDIAEIMLTYEDNSYYARFNGQRAIFITVKQKEKTNIFTIVKEIKQHIGDFKEKLPAGIQLASVYDQSQSVEERLGGFASNLWQGMILVGLVIFVAIGFRGSIIVMTAIPVSLLIGVGALFKSGYGLEQMSISGLVITLGMLVDNAIVVVENVSRFIRNGETNMNAAVKGTSQIGWAIVASTVTTILAFIPIATMQDISGEFIRSMPLIVVFTLIASLLTALTLTPWLAGRWLKPGALCASTRFMYFYETFVRNHYRRWLRSALKKPALILTVAVTALLGSLALIPLIGITFFPKAEKPQFFIDVNLPEGAALKETDRAVAFVENQLKQLPEIALHTANIGRSNPRIYYNIIEKQKQSNFGQLLVELKKETSRSDMEKLIQKLRRDLDRYPGARIEIKLLEQGPPVNAPVEIIVKGEKMAVLKKIAADIEQLFRQTPGLINIDNPMSTAKSDIRVAINRDKASMYGIPLAEIDRAVRMSIAGITVSKYRDKDAKSYDLVLRAQNDGEPRLDIFEKICLSTASGALIPLKQVATIELKLSSGKINHYNLNRSVTLTADVLEGYTVSEVTPILMEKLAAYRWPIGYDYFVAGEKQSQEESFGGMGEASLIALIAVFAVLVLQFRSFRQPLIVFSAIPLSAIGAILGLLLSGNYFSFTAFIGLTSLVGIVVNNSIILVDYTNQLMEEGKELSDALVESGSTRLLPILLTTLTTIGGLTPLALSGGTLWAPLGWTIIGGLTTSTMLTLIVVPVLYKTVYSQRTAEA